MDSWTQTAEPLTMVVVTTSILSVFSLAWRLQWPCLLKKIEKLSSSTGNFFPFRRFRPFWWKYHAEKSEPFEIVSLHIIFVVLSDSIAVWICRHFVFFVVWSACVHATYAGRHHVFIKNDNQVTKHGSKCSKWLALAHSIGWFIFFSAPLTAPQTEEIRTRARKK